ncbi:MAG: hypothetical protein ACYTGS_20425 [Planctomycetota bacterium]|jgi:hypothetical protein
MKRKTALLYVLVGLLLAGLYFVEKGRLKITIVPGVRVGEFTLGMSKDAVLKKLGEPKAIFLGGQRYTLDNLPKRYFMSYGDVSFFIEDGSVTGIGVFGPPYTFANGLGVGDSEDKIKQAFGDNFQLDEREGQNALIYKEMGLRFEFHGEDRTVDEISVNQPVGNRTDSDAPESRRVITLSEQPPGPIPFPKIDRRPPAADYPWGKVTELPTYNADSRDFQQVDLRSRDLSGLNLRSSLEALLHASFDDRTAWPAENRIPKDFDPRRIMELGKHPGPGIRDLHTQGITGEGVGIAIINQRLLVDHQEYRNQLRLYEETDDSTDGRSQMFGVAMASLAVGKTVGVAPAADLYYIATRRGGSERKFNDSRYVARSIRRFLQVNEGLPQERRIRVIALAKGWSKGVVGYEDVTQATEAAKAAGMWLVYPGDKQEHGFRLGGLGRSPLADPNSFVSYEPSALDLREEQAKLYDSGRLFVPLDSRTTAGPTGNDEYVFYRQGYPGWSVSYIAGIYALAVQVEPTVTPERFWSLARQTGRTLKVDKQGETVSLGPIVDPVVLIRTLQESSDKLD